MMTQQTDQRGRGRPPSENPRSERVSMAIDPRLKSDLMDEARGKGIALSELVHRILERHIGR